MANEFLKGYTIKINGETTEFEKAMNQVTKSGQNLSKELNGLNKQLKLDPTNVEKLSQKMDILKQKEANAKDQLEKYKDAQKAMEASGIDKNSDDWHDLQGRINQAEAQVEQYNNAIKETKKQMDSINAEKLKKVADQAQKTGEAMTKYVTGSIIALATASEVAWKAIDDAYDNIISKTGATGEEAEKLQSTFNDIYGDFAFESQDVSDAVGGLSTRLGLTGDELEDASVKFLKFAEINNVDVESAVSLVTRAMGDASIPAEEYGEMLDLLTKASQASGISIEALTENVTKYGAPMRALGFTTEESIAIFSQWEKAGVNTEIAFSGMKKAISNWSAEGKDAREEFKKTLDEIANCPDIASATTKAIEVFGAKAGPDLADAIQGGRFEYEDFLGVLQDSQGVLESTFDATQDPADRAVTAFHNLQMTLADLGGTIQEVLAPVIEAVNEKLKAFRDWFANLNPNIKKTIVEVLGIVAVLGPLILIITKVSSGISNLMKGVGMLSNPITAVVLIIGLLAVAFVTLWNNSEAFRTKVTEIATTIQTTLQPIIQSVSDFITNEVIPVLQELWAFFQEYILPVLQVVADIIINVVIVALQVLWDFFSTYILPILQQLWETFTTYILPVLEQFGAFISGVIIPVLQTLWGWFQQYLLPVIQTVANIIGGTLTIAFGVLNTAISVVCDIVSGFIKALEGVWKFLEDLGVIEAFGQAFQVVGDIINAIVSAFQWIADNVMGIFNSIGEGISNVVGGLGDVISFLNPFDAGGYGDLIRQGGTMSMTTNITVNNNGSQISKAEIVRWGETITDVVDERLGRRIR